MRKRTVVIITIMLLLLVILLLVLFNSYIKSEEDKNLVQNITTTNSSINLNSDDAKNIENNEGGEENMKSNVELNIKIGDRNFTATLEDNETTRSLLEKLPLTINMSELNGNEKYYYFNETLPTNTERVGNINTGDLMLYGSDCLVLFYDSFSTSYSYTRLGHIDNPEGLAEAVGIGNVEATFEISNN